VEILFAAGDAMAKRLRTEGGIAAQIIIHKKIRLKNSTGFVF
jgi:hypothetical protein